MGILFRGDELGRLSPNDYGKPLAITCDVQQADPGNRPVVFRSLIDMSPIVKRELPDYLAADVHRPEP